MIVGHETCVPIVVDGKVRPLKVIMRDVVESVMGSNDGDLEKTAAELQVSQAVLCGWLNGWTEKKGTVIDA